ncbi:TIGR02678 family protein [Vulgatibacter incomptus]|uniref:TIGR02678 family protein n=1 Tax=Vulgatibacter incomptus TaxID=1391653 RepID=A0A0K1PGU6_9BACT|nr:TIGR02678 family protein [Vulgatibacter incomptus]AKU92735.1 Hypothetical protein AKJ08_3122 [Vulgatibacter incomptus]
MSRLVQVLEDDERAQRVAAIRALLASPLLSASSDPEIFRTVVRQRAYLTEWFASHPGWRLVIDPSGGYARLHKVPGRSDTTKPARRADGTPFDRRRYALLCLTLAALDDAPVQTTVGRIAALVEEASADDEEGVAFDPSLAAERRAFVDALRLLVSLGVLRVRDGDADRYAHTREGDALLDVNERVLGQLLAAPIPPVFAGTPEGMLDEQLPDTDEGQRLSARYRVIRRLLEDPVLYYDDLDARAFDWLDHSRGFLYALLEDDVGMPIERRREGLAAIDPEGLVTDERFPDGGSTVRHAALLLASHLAKQGERDVAVERGALVEVVTALQADHSERWSKQYSADEQGAAQLCEEAVALLEAFGLVRHEGDGRLRVRPAVARFSPGEPKKKRAR